MVWALAESESQLPYPAPVRGDTYPQQIYTSETRADSLIDPEQCWILALIGVGWPSWWRALLITVTWINKK